MALRLRGDEAAPAPLDAAALAVAVSDLDHEPEWSKIENENCAWSSDRDVRFEAVREITKRNLDVVLADAASDEVARSTAAKQILTGLERELERRIEKLIRILDDEWEVDGDASRELIAL